MTRDKPKLALVMCCYGQPKLMAEQLHSWRKFPADVKKALEIIVIDDAGTPPYEPPAPEDALIHRAFRVLKDIPWNQPGAKNLGFKHVTAPWVVNMDPDMIFSRNAMRKIFDFVSQMKRGHFYKLALHHEDGSKLADYGSPNFYIVHRLDFWAAGGYNEDFSGHKGYSDVVLHRTLVELYKAHRLPHKAIFHGPRSIPDSQVTCLDRSYDHNKKLFHQAIKFASQNGWKRYHLTFRGKGYCRFPWKEVSPI